MADGQWAIYVAAHALLAACLGAAKLVALPLLAQTSICAGAIVYIGSHLSLTLVCGADTKSRTDSAEEARPLSKASALAVPLLASSALLAAFVAFWRYGQRVACPLLIRAGLVLAGFVGLAETLVVLSEPWLRGQDSRWSLRFWVPLLTNWKGDTVVLSFGKAQILVYAASACVSVAYICTEDWTLQNVLTAAISIQAVGRIAPGRLATALLLLVALCAYDAHWFFRAQAVVQGAVQFQGPAKIVFPTQHDPWTGSVLGIGDIVVPGLFVAVCLRLDAANTADAASEGQLEGVSTVHRPSGANPIAGLESSRDEAGTEQHRSFQKRTFWPVYFAFLVGVVARDLAVSRYERPLAPLQFFAPAMVLAFVCAVAAGRGLRCALAYTEHEVGGGGGIKED